MFIELYREEKREEGDRGGKEDKGVGEMLSQFSSAQSLGRVRLFATP